MDTFLLPAVVIMLFLCFYAGAAPFCVQRSGVDVLLVMEGGAVQSEELSEASDATSLLWRSRYSDTGDSRSDGLAHGGRCLTPCSDPSNGLEPQQLFVQASQLSVYVMWLCVLSYLSSPFVLWW